VTQHQREHAKHMAYGLLYGKGVKSLAADMGVSEETAAQRSPKFKGSLPGVCAWMDKVGGALSARERPACACRPSPCTQPPLATRRATPWLAYLTDPPHSSQPCDLQVVEDCQRDTYVTTLAGRRRYLPNITSSKWSERKEAERQAVNSMCQGSAADLVERAMVQLVAVLGRVGHLQQQHWTMVLQVSGLMGPC
jgi:DNA polymerase theta